MHSSLLVLRLCFLCVVYAKHREARGEVSSTASPMGVLEKSRPPQPPQQMHFQTPIFLGGGGQFKHTEKNGPHSLQLFDSNSADGQNPESHYVISLELKRIINGFLTIFAY